MQSLTDMARCNHRTPPIPDCHKCLFRELLEELEPIYRQADGWCCADDSGDPSMRFADIATQLRALIDKAKLLDPDCEARR
jgi:hypothetical protein